MSYLIAGGAGFIGSTPADPYLFRGDVVTNGDSGFKMTFAEAVAASLGNGAA